MTAEGGPGMAPVSFDDVYPDLLGRGYRAAFRVLGRREEAEDIACEALARAWSRWKSVASHAEPWVVRVSVNLAIDASRRRRWESTQVLLDEPVEDSQAELRLDLVKAVRALPRRQREVVALRFFGDLTEKATAEALGIDVGNVKAHTARALPALRTRTNEGEHHVS